MGKKVKTVEKLPNDLEFMQDENRWPCWPYLPMKNHSDLNNRRYACLLADNGPKLFLGNMFQGIDENTKTEEFPSYEAILAAGWVID